MFSCSAYRPMLNHAAAEYGGIKWWATRRLSRSGVFLELTKL